MQPKTTSDLNQELFEQPNLDAYLEENLPTFSPRAVGNLLKELQARKPLSKAALARRANMSEVYLHQIFSGRRTPSRDRLLCLCIGLEATLDETQALLRQASYAVLYPRLERDAIIAHGIVHKAGLDQINDNLLIRREQPLC